MAEQAMSNRKKTLKFIHFSQKSDFQRTKSRRLKTERAF
jgi:hypothetical protein